MKPVNRRSLIKSGVVAVSASAYTFVDASFKDSNAQSQNLQPRLFVNGSPAYSGVSVSLYDPNDYSLYEQIPDHGKLEEIPMRGVDEEHRSIEFSRFVAGLLYVSWTRGEGNPRQWRARSFLEDRGAFILDQHIFGDTTTRAILSESKQFYWIHSSPAALLVLGGPFVVAIAALSGSFLDELGRQAARDIYPEIKAFFLELFD